MKKQSEKLFPIKNTFTYPSGKVDVVMARSMPAQNTIEEDIRKVTNLTEIKIKHKKEFFWQWNSQQKGSLV